MLKVAYNEKERKPVEFIGSSLRDLTQFPAEVRSGIGYALYEAQIGRKSPHAKPLKGFGGAGVLEIVENFDGDTYRGVYTVRFANIVYVLHCFQKKSRQGTRTDKNDMDTVRARLRAAEAHHRERGKGK